MPLTTLLGLFGDMQGEHETTMLEVSNSQQEVQNIQTYVWLWMFTVNILLSHVMSHIKSLICWHKIKMYH